MSKSLKVFKGIKYVVGGHEYYDLDAVDKLLKALEIIRTKGIDIIEFKRCKKAKTYNENTKRTYCQDYTQEEYDLLKEILL